MPSLTLTAVLFFNLMGTWVYLSNLWCLPFGYNTSLFCCYRGWVLARILHFCNPHHLVLLMPQGTTYQSRKHRGLLIPTFMELTTKGLQTTFNTQISWLQFMIFYLSNHWWDYLRFCYVAFAFHVYRVCTIIFECVVFWFVQQNISYHILGINSKVTSSSLSLLAGWVILLVLRRLRFN
jgi:hypothetical protein